MLCPRGFVKQAPAGDRTTATQMLSESELVGAVLRGASDEVSRLLDARADVNQQDSSGNTALLVAAYNGDSELAWLLCDAGAKINFCDAAGYTPLMLAARKNHADLARLLVSTGADTSLRDRSGATALDLARDAGHSDVVGVLDPAATRRGLAISDDDDDEDEYAADDLMTGNVVILDHTVKLDVPLHRFPWERYETALAQLAGVPEGDVLVTPEPGSVCVEAHATILLRLDWLRASASASAKPGLRSTSAANRSTTGALGGNCSTALKNAGSTAGRAAASTPTSLVDLVSSTIQALKKAPALKQAAAGATLVGTPQVMLQGDIAEEDAGGFREVVRELYSMRAEHAELRGAYEDARGAMNAASVPKAKPSVEFSSNELALLASRAILLLRPGREGIQEAAAQMAAAQSHRRRRR